MSGQAARDGQLVGAPEVIDVVRERAAAGSRPGHRDDPHRVALVVEGGVVRGTITGGMGLELHEGGLLSAFDHIYGASAGAITAAWLTSRTPQSLIGWTEPAYTKMLIRPGAPLRRKPFIDVRVLSDVVYTELVPMDFDSILASPMPWHPMATDADTGSPTDLRPYLHTPEQVRLALRATCTIPVLGGNPVELGGRTYVDVGVSEPMPFHTAVADGAATHVLVLRSRRANDIPGTSRATSLFARTLRQTQGRYGYGEGFARTLSGSSMRYMVADHMLAGRQPLPESYPPIASLRPALSSPTVGRFTLDRQVLIAGFEAGRDAVRRVFG